MTKKDFADFISFDWKLINQYCHIVYKGNLQLESLKMHRTDWELLSCLRKLRKGTVHKRRLNFFGLFVQGSYESLKRQDWKATLERAHFFKVRSDRITVCDVFYERPKTFSCQTSKASVNIFVDLCIYLKGYLHIALTREFLKEDSLH